MAHDPILAQEITNGHAARMRYSRFKSAMLGLEPQRRKRNKEKNKVAKSKRGLKTGRRAATADSEDSRVAKDEDEDYVNVKLEKVKFERECQAASSTSTSMMMPGSSIGLGISAGGHGVKQESLTRPYYEPHFIARPESLSPAGLQYSSPAQSSPHGIHQKIFIPGSDANMLHGAAQSQVGVDTRACQTSEGLLSAGGISSFDLSAASTPCPHEPPSLSWSSAAQGCISNFENLYYPPSASSQEQQQPQCLHSHNHHHKHHHQAENHLYNSVIKHEELGPHLSPP